MAHRLTTEKKEKLINLLSPNDAEFFLSDVEYMMKHNFLPSGSQEKHVLKKKAKALAKISKSARKLRTELNVLDPYLLRFIDSDLGKELGTPYFHESMKVGDKPALCYPDLSSKDAIRIIEEAADFHSNNILAQYGSNYLEWATERLWIAWDKSIDHKVTTSIGSKFIQYLAIVLEGEEESISKQVQRTKWFNDLKKYSRDKNKKN